MLIACREARIQAARQLFPVTLDVERLQQGFEFRDFRVRLLALFRQFTGPLLAVAAEKDRRLPTLFLRLVNDVADSPGQARQLLQGSHLAAACSRTYELSA